MKTPKSSDSEEVTPSKKILKQARLPFKLLSEVSPKSVTPPSRKRKLSIPNPEPVSKIGKITKEEELSSNAVVISDDDSKESVQDVKVPKTLNPLVKLVDIARKKKLQKNKSSKKRKNPSKIAVKSSPENYENASKQNTDKSDVEEAMDIDGEEENEGKQTDTIAFIDNNDIEETENSDDTVNKKIKSTKKDTNSNKALNGIKEKVIETTISNNDHVSDPSSEVSVKQRASENKSLVSVTPKRSERNKSKTDDNLNTSKTSNCDESLSSNPSTPRRSVRNVSITNSQGDTSITESANTNITPKQLQKKLESAKKKEEREKEKLEREKKKQQEKEDRIKQKLEKDEQRKKEREEKEDAKRKEREEKEEQRKREKEEKEKQKELEKKLKEEKEEQKRKEKEEKEDQKKREKEAREEEKRKRQEVLEQEKIEQEQKKKKAAEAFASFFVAKQKSEKDQITIGPMSNNMLSSFTIKSDMRLAPIVRNQLQEDSKKELENFLVKQNVPELSLYLKGLKDRKPFASGKTWPPCDKDDDVIIVEDELPPADGIGEMISCEPVIQEKLRPKLLSFHENRRPPYWGTWRKKSSSITPRRPFKTDEKLLDYEVDSDEEWEEEQEGESIDGSAAGSDDEHEVDEYEVDNEVFVPHGYLSDEEATMDEDDVLSLSPEAQKAKLKHLEDEFESEMKKPMEKLKPRLFGLLWEKSEGGKPDNCTEALWNYISKFSMIIDPSPVLQPASENEEPEKKKVKKKRNTEGENQSPKSDKKKKSKNEDNGKNSKTEAKKTITDSKKNQPDINYFLTKLKTS